jgi:protein PhnA
VAAQSGGWQGGGRPGGGGDRCAGRPPWCKRPAPIIDADQTSTRAACGRSARFFFLGKGTGVSDDSDEYVYDEATGEWRPASEIAAAAAEALVVRDAAGNVLADGDSVALVKDLKVKGTSQTLKQGTVIKSIRLTDNPEEIDCRHESIKGLVLRTEFVRKR